MTAVTFASMVPDLSAHLPGCPNITIERSVRKIATDLCNRGKVWKVELAPITLVVSTYAYIPASPVAYAEVFDYVSGHTTIGGTKRDLVWNTVDQVTRSYPQWPLNTAGTPQLITSKVLKEYQVCPVPDAAGTMTLTVHLRPTMTATDWDADVYAEHHRAIFHGVLHDLMAMPGRPWTNGQGSGYHGKQWTYLLNQAKDRASRGYNNGNLSVEMRPLA